MKPRLWTRRHAQCKWENLARQPLEGFDGSLCPVEEGFALIAIFPGQGELIAVLSLKWPCLMFQCSPQALASLIIVDGDCAAAFFTAWTRCLSLVWPDGKNSGKVAQDPTCLRDKVPNL